LQQAIDAANSGGLPASAIAQLNTVYEAGFAQKKAGHRPAFLCFLL